MTVNPEDIPDGESDTALEIYPVSFFDPGTDGDFRPIIMESDGEEEESALPKD